MREKYLIERIQVDGSTIRVQAGKNFQTRYLADHFFVEYSEGNLRSLDPSIIAVPFILNVAPVVWLSGEEFWLESIDATLASALENLRASLQEMYPDIKWRGRLVPKRIVENNGPRDSGAAEAAIQRAGILFSGGLDSVFTALRNHGEGQLLITICGADIAFDNWKGWAVTQRQASKFGEQFGFRNAFIRSNFKWFLNTSRLLGSKAPCIPSWWGYVQHGMGLAGLAAPLLTSNECTRLLIASTHTKDYSGGWGSHPSIDNKIKWGNVSVSHDGFDFTRQEKLRSIIGLCAKENLEGLDLRVCYSEPYGTGGNCCECEKCLRTTTGLLIEHQDITRFGFDSSQSKAINVAQRRFKNGSIHLGEDELFMWKGLQSRVRERIGKEGICGYPEQVGLYLDWLVSCDLDAYKRYQDKKWSWEQKARTTLGRVPFGYKIAYKTYRTLHRIKNSAKSRRK